jgi:hypothetical protein
MVRLFGLRLVLLAVNSLFFRHIIFPFFYFPLGISIGSFVVLGGDYG